MSVSQTPNIDNIQETTNVINNDTISVKLKELWEIERILHQESNPWKWETEIDKAFREKNIDNISDLSTKVKLIEELINYYTKESNLYVKNKNNGRYRANNWFGGSEKLKKWKKIDNDIFGESTETKESKEAMALKRKFKWKHWVKVVENTKTWEINLDIESGWIKLWENATITLTSEWNINIINSLWYNFQFDKDISKSAWSMLEIMETSEFIDKSWLWFFKWDFKDIISTIKSVSSLIGWLITININESLGNADFLDKRELNRVFDIFADLWLFNQKWMWFKSVNNVSTMTKADFTQKQDNELTSFYKNWIFNKDEFKNTLISTYSN